MPEIEYIEETIEALRPLINKNLILIVTATDTESRELHRILSPFPEFKSIVKVNEGTLTYYFGLLGNYKIGHVQCAMGSMGRDSSILTTTDALKITGTNTVIMPGIAFGVDKLKQRIGDVLVAEGCAALQ